MQNPELRSHLEAISRALLRLHKALLDFQKSTMEKLSGKQLTPHEVLHLSINHSDFAWLRKISALIVRIDETTEDKSAELVSFYATTIEELRSLFFDSNKNEETDFKTRLEIALKNDPKTTLFFDELKKVFPQA